MIFELPDIFFGSHPKKEMASQPPQVRQYGFIKKDEKALPQAAFSKNPVISFSVLRATKTAAFLSKTAVFSGPWQNSAVVGGYALSFACG